MAGQLSDKYMDTLEKWIGTGPKTFTLLYSITKDGCNATTFHQKCNNQGATVTVLYNQSKSIYGGYTSQSWTSRGNYFNDGSAFLFKLQFNGQPGETKFIRNGNGNDVYDYSSYGPTFGGGTYHDLHTFSGTVTNNAGLFPLNGNMSLGNSYSASGVQVAQVNNGNMSVTELEVYKVSDGTRTRQLAVSSPWRKSPPWDNKLLEDSTKEIIAFKPQHGLKISAARLILIGPVGAGKSSFANTINSIMKGYITQMACSGSSEQSLTTKYTPYQIRLRNGTPLNFRLCDSRGLEDGQGMDLNECSFLLDGHVPDFYQFNPATPINAKTGSFVASPKLDNQAHGVIFVLDATTLDVMSDKVLQKMKEFQKVMNQKGLVQTLLLTKVDKLCDMVSSDVSLTYSSTTVEAAVDKAANLLGIPRFNIWPVKNYEKEMDLDENTSILALLALRQILRFTESYLENLFYTLECDGAIGSGNEDE